MKTVGDKKLAAPCGLYCGACLDYPVCVSCHGCSCGIPDASGHHERCNIYTCCVEQRVSEAWSECKEFRCLMLIRFCHSLVWLHHLPVLENLRRRKVIGREKWLKERKENWSNKWDLGGGFGAKKNARICESSLEESKDIFSRK